jgi:hypothetical protein
MEETMNTKLWIMLLTLIITLIPIIVQAQNEEPEIKFGENKIIYTPKYVDAQALGDLLRNLAEGIENCEVWYNDSFNTIIITAPKETLGMFRKLLEKYDKIPEKALLRIFLIKTSAKGHLDQSTLDALKPALNQLKQFDLKNGFELVGSSTTPLLINKSQEGFTSVMDSESIDKAKYHLSLENITLTSETMTIGELRLGKIDARHEKREELYDDDYETSEVMNGSFTASFGESTVFVKGTKSNAMILVFILEKIKN